MKDITLSVPDKDYSFFMKVIKQFDFVEVKEKKKKERSKKEFLDGLSETVEQVNQIKAGKLKGRPFQELLDELM